MQMIRQEHDRSNLKWQGPSGFCNRLSEGAASQIRRRDGTTTISDNREEKHPSDVIATVTAHGHHVQGQRTLTRLIDRAYAGFSFNVTPYEFARAQCESSRLSLE